MACTETKLNQLAAEFRVALIACDKNSLFVTLQDYPIGACGDASYLLAKYFEEKGCGKFDYVLGKRRSDFHSHVWLEQNNLIVDITADQFDGVSKGVLVTSDRSWHLQFEEEDRQLADFERYDTNMVSNLRSSYKMVLDKIEA